MRKLSIINGILLFLFVSPVLAGETGGGEIHHVILAFDEAGTSWRGTDPDVIEHVKEFLFHYKEDGILGEKDYFSIVGFKGDFLDSNHWKDYVYFKSLTSTGPIVFQRGRVIADLITSVPSIWRRLAGDSPFITNQGYSLLSVAKPFILYRFGLEQNRPQVTHTYIVLITDHRYNGNDYYNELKFFLDNNSHYRDTGVRTDSVLSQCYRVEEEYCIKLLDSWDSNNEQLLSHNVELFEVHPNQDYLTLPAVLEYPPSLELKRALRHRYSLSLDIKHKNPHYEVCELRVFLHNKESGTERLVDTIKEFKEYSKDFDFAQVEGFSQIRMEADLRLQDGFYGCTLLTPETVPGLIQTIELVPDENATILGLCKMPDWMWWTMWWVEDPHQAAFGFSVILGLLIIAGIVLGVLLIVHAVQRYKPSIDDVEIVFYEE